MPRVTKYHKWVPAGEGLFKCKHCEWTKCTRQILAGEFTSPTGEYWRDKVPPCQRDKVGKAKEAEKIFKP